MTDKWAGRWRGLVIPGCHPSSGLWFACIHRRMSNGLHQTRTVSGGWVHWETAARAALKAAQAENSLEDWL